MPLQQVGLLILPSYHIAQFFLSPLEALAVACNPVYRVIVPYHTHWLLWQSKKLEFMPESKQKENEINSDTMAI
jgi:hypothetical protein